MSAGKEDAEEGDEYSGEEDNEDGSHSGPSGPDNVSE